jgi:hypothetical protein
MGIENIAIDPITVDLDKPRELIFTLKSFSMLSKKYGSVQNALVKFFQAEEIKTLSEGYVEVLCDMAHAGFSHYGKDFPPEMIDDAIDTKNIYALIVAIRDAVTLAVPKPADDGDPPKAV